MAYATVQDLIDRYGQVELIRLTTPADQELDAIVMEVAEAKLDDASALIDSYVRLRYRTPLDVSPPEIRRACCILARYDLSTGDQRAPSEQMRVDHKDIVDWLRDISNGRVKLDLEEVAAGDESFAQAQEGRPAVFGTARGAH